MTDNSRDDGYHDNAKFVMSEPAKENFQDVAEKISGKTYGEHPCEATEKIKEEKRPHFYRRHTKTKRHKVSKTIHKSHRVSQKKAARTGNFLGHDAQFTEEFILGNQSMSVPPPQKEKGVVARECSDKRTEKDQRQIQIPLLNRETSQHQNRLAFKKGTDEYREITVFNDKRNNGR